MNARHGKLAHVLLVIAAAAMLLFAVSFASAEGECPHPEESWYTSWYYAGGDQYTEVDSERLHLNSHTEALYNVCGECRQRIGEPLETKQVASYGSHTYEWDDDANANVCRYCGHVSTGTLNKTVTVSVDETEVLTNESFEITVTALDASSVYLYYGNGGSGLNVPVSLFAHSIRYAGPVDIYAIATYEDGSQVESEHLTVTAVAPYGRLAKPPVTVNELYQEGEDVVITVGEVEHAETYEVSVSKDYQIFYQKQATPGSFTIPADQLERGCYFLRALAEGVGSEYSLTDVYFTVGEHLNTCEVTEVREVREDNGSNLNHTVLQQEVRFTRCSDCGKEWDVEVLSTLSTWTSEHRWDENGVCQDCGRENTCLHDGEVPYHYTAVGGYTYRDVGSNRVHQYEYAQYRFPVCALCHLRLGENEYERQVIEYSTHNYSWDENGAEVCSTCGHVRTDEVDKTVSISVSKTDVLIHEPFQVTATALDANYMELRGVDEDGYEWNAWDWGDVGAGTCTQDIDNPTTREYYVIAHFDDGDTAESEHVTVTATAPYGTLDAPVITVNEFYQEGEDVTFTVGEVEHAGTYYVYVYYIDTDDVIYGEMFQQPAAVTLPAGQLSNGCYRVWAQVDGVGAYSRSNVAYFTVGAHSGIYEENEWRYIYEDNGTDFTHTTTEQEVRVTRCNACGKVISEEILSTSEPWEASHNWNEETGVCRDCGRVNACPHENAYSSWWFSEITGYTDNGDGTHTVTGTRVDCSFCEDCGLNYNFERTEGYSESRAHDWLGGEGICYYCGAECPHPEDHLNTGWYSETAEYQYLDVGSNRVHQVVYTNNLHNVCGDCGVVVGEPLESRQESYYEMHNYMDDGNGLEVCFDCNHINTYLTDKTVTISVSKTDVLIYEPFQIILTALDASSMELRCVDEDGYDWNVWSWNDTAVIPYDQNIGGQTTREYYVIARFDSGDEAESEHVTVTATAPYGQLALPVITVNDLYPAGEDVTFTVGEVEHASKYYIDVYHFDTGETVYNQALQQPAAVTLPAGQLSNGCYRIWVQVDGVGAYSNASEAYFTVGAHSGVYEETEGRYIYADNGTDTTHTVTQQEVRVTRCGVCGKVISEEILSTSEPWEASHNWNEETGVCWDCSRVNACPHENAYSSWWFSEITGYTDNGDGTHTVTGTRIDYDYCDDCGLNYNYVVTEGYSESRAHNWRWGEGICADCGAECPHPEDHLSTAWHDAGDYQYLDVGSNRVHQLTYTENLYNRCNDCGVTIGEPLESRQATTHTGHSYAWDDDIGADVCDKCGHVQTGEVDKTVSISVSKTDVLIHEPFQITVTALDADYISLYYLSDDGEHWVTDFWSASGSGKYWITWETVWEYYIIAHFDDGDEVESEHVTVTATAPYGTLDAPVITVNDLYPAGEDVTFTVGEVEHASKYYIDVYHFDTGETVYNQALQQPAAVTLPAGQLSNGCYRIWVQVDGVGAYSNASEAYFTVGAHSGVYEETEGRYIYADNGTDTTHTVAYQEVRVTRCGVCGKVISEEILSTSEPWEESHNWNEETGVCRDCCRVNACLHENAEQTWYWDGTLEYADNGDNTHTVTGTRVEYTHCNDCGLNYNFVETEGYSESQAHNWRWGEGICDNCGAECPHPEDHLSTAWHDAGDSQYLDVGSNRVHQVTCTENLYEACNDCGVAFGEVLDSRQGTDYRQHNYIRDEETGAEVCSNCGHVRTDELDKAMSISVSKTNVLSNETFQITATALDASSIELYSRDSYGNHYCTCRWYNGGGTYDFVLAGDATAEFYIIAYYDDGDTAESEHVTVTCTAPYGSLAPAAISVNELYQEGEDVTFTVGEVAGAESYYVWVIDPGTWDYVYASGELQQTGTFTVPASRLSYGCYQIQVQACRVGAYNSHNVVSFAVGGHRGELDEEIEDRYVFTDNGTNSTHTAVLQQMRVTRCSLCGKIMDEEVLSTGASYKWRHNWDADGVCMDCGRVNTCTHDGHPEYEYYSFGDGTYIDVGSNRVHQYAYDMYRRLICSLCYAALGEQEYDGQRITYYDHDYEWSDEAQADVCVDCGHVRTDAVDKTVSLSVDRTDILTGETVRFTVEALDANHIELHYTMESNPYDQVYTEWSRGGGTYDWNIRWADTMDFYVIAYYDDGDTLESEHVTVTVSAPNGALDAPVVTVNELYEEGENVTFTVGEVNGAEEYYVRVYDQEGYCIFGSALSRAGEHTIPASYFEPGCYHIWAEARGIGYIDSDCDAWFTVGDHLSTYEGTEWRFAYEDNGTNTTHTVIQQEVRVTRCNACGKIVSEEIVSTAGNGRDGHSWDDNGVCTQCGRVNTCTHENGSEHYSFMEDIDSCTDNGDGTHTAVGTMLEYDVCLDCQQSLNEVRTEGVTEVGKHRYNNGVCADCHAVCDHPEDQRREVWRSYAGSGSTQYVDVESDQNHMVTNREDLVTVCDVCGTVIGDALDTRQTPGNIEPHSYVWSEEAQAEVCQLCGHVKTGAVNKTVTISASSTDVLTAEGYQIRVLAPDCDEIELRCQDESGYEWSEGWGSYYRSWYCSTEHPITLRYYAVAHFADGTQATTETVEVRITAPYGRIMLNISAPAQIEEGRRLPLTVEMSEGFSYCWIDVFDQNGYYVTTFNANPSGGTTQEFTVPAAELSPGLYHIQARACGAGYETCIKSITVLVGGWPNTVDDGHVHTASCRYPDQCALCGATTSGDGIEIELSHNYISSDLEYSEEGHFHYCLLCGEPLEIAPHEFDEYDTCIHCGYAPAGTVWVRTNITEAETCQDLDIWLYAKGADEMQLTETFNDENVIEIDERAWKDDMALFTRENSACRITFTLAARFGDEWKEASATITVSAPNGDLETPVLDVPERIEENEDLVIHVTVDEHADEYYVIIQDSDGHDVTMAANEASVSVPASQLPKGAYHIIAIANGRGYNQGSTETVVLVGDVDLMPTILAQPADATVAKGATAAFAVDAEGEDLTYQWYYQKPGETAWNAIQNNGTSAVYSITTAARHNGYSYRCEVTNSGGTVTSETAHLTVVSKPVITAQPGSVTVAEGQDAVFTVEVSGEELTYQWYYQKPGSTAWSACKNNGSSDSYTIATEARHNGYSYRCKVTNIAGSMTSEAARLTVVSMPTITAQPASMTVAQGETATFTVEAAGEDLTYQWYYQKPGTTSWTACKNTGTSATYSVTTEARHDGYSYRCKVSNALGSVYTDAASLTVTSGVTLAITSQPASVTVAKGETATFTVVAEGENLTYQWYYQKPGTTTWTACKNNGNSASYSVVTEERHNGYSYRCTVSDGASSLTSDAAQLTVASKPVITAQPSSLTVKEGAAATFTVAASGDGLTYQWYYQKAGSTSWSACKNNGTSASYTVVTEARHNGYSYRCKVSNSAGSVYTEAASLTVTSGVALAITSQPASLTVTKGATATFTVVAEGEGLTYQWYYMKPGTSAWNACSNSGTSASYSVVTAARHNGYSYCCEVKDGSGESMTSAVATLTVQ